MVASQLAWVHAWQACTVLSERHSHVHCRCSRWMTCPPGTTWGAAALSACYSAVHRPGSSQTPLIVGEPRASRLLEHAGVHLAWLCPHLRPVLQSLVIYWLFLSWIWVTAYAARRIEARHFGDLGQQVVNYHKKDLPRLEKDPQAYKVIIQA